MYAYDSVPRVAILFCIRVVPLRICMCCIRIAHTYKTHLYTAHLHRPRIKRANGSLIFDPFECFNDDVSSLLTFEASKPKRIVAAKNDKDKAPKKVMTPKKVLKQTPKKVLKQTPKKVMKQTPKKTPKKNSTPSMSRNRFYLPRIGV